MRGLRRSTALTTAAATAWVLASAGLATVPPATAVATTVPVTVSVVNPSDDPVSGFVVIGRYGPGENDESYGTTDAAGVVVLRVPPNITVDLLNVIRTTPGGPSYTHLNLDAGPTGTSTTIHVPTRMSHTYRVVDPQGRPVFNARVRVDLFTSALVSDPVWGDYRMGDGYWDGTTPVEIIDPGVTRADGRTALPLRWWTPEPDPAVACAPLWTAIDPGKCDQDRDGTVDGMFVELGGAMDYPFARGVAVPYTQWAVPGTQEITMHVPYVPVVEVVGQRPGTRTGEVALTVRVLRPSGTSWVPAVGWSIDPGIFFRNVDRSRTTRTDVHGVAEIRYWGLPGPRRVIVTPGLAVVATPTLQPSRGIAVGRTVYNPRGKDSSSRKSLNSEYVSVTNTSSTAVSLKKWTVTTKAGKRYTFGRFTLKPGATVVLHTGRGKNTATDRYWGSRRHLWSTTDKAIIRRPSGTVVASCLWRHNGPGIARCVS